MRKFWMGDSTDQRLPDSLVWLMGRQYGPFNEDEMDDRYGEFQKFVRDFKSRLWFTYRSGFEPIKPTRLSTDAGWGCMLRSGQMVLGEALLRHKLGADWQLGHNMRDVVMQYSQIVTWFLDRSNQSSPFSIHQIATEGERYDKKIGEWFGPSTIAAVLRDLVQRHRPFGLSAYVAQDGVIFKNKVLEAAQAAPTANSKFAGKAAADLDVDDEDASESGHANSSTKKDAAADTFHGVLILVPLRLGLDYMNEIYVPALKKFFEFPQSVGIAGGRPNSSLYFVAVDRSLLYFLDPHITRPQVPEKLPHLATEDDWRSYHCGDIRRLDISRIDPSLMLAFYCRTRADLDDLFERAHACEGECPAIFTVAEEAPRFYDEDIDLGVSATKIGGDDDEEDDYDLM